MLCNNCNSKNADFHYKYIYNNELAEVHLCEECAKKLGYMDKFTNSFDIGAFFDNGFFGNFFAVPEKAKKAAVGARCDTCGTDFAEFKKTGRFGCPKCYNAFGEPVDRMLSSMQQSNVHKGKIAGKTGDEARISHKIKQLKEELKKAILEEKYEEAACLRDEIKKLESEAR